MKTKHIVVYAHSIEFYETSNRTKQFENHLLFGSLGWTSVQTIQSNEDQKFNLFFKLIELRVLLNHQMHNTFKAFVFNLKLELSQKSYTNY